MKDFIDQRLKSLSAIALTMFIFFLVTQTFINIADLKLKKRSAIVTNVINARGTAEVNVVPDVATFSFTVRQEAKDVETAQQEATLKVNQALDALKQKGVTENNFRTANYDTYPKYTYVAPACKKNVCPPGNQVISGYEASQTITVKLREIAKAGEILNQISQLQIGEVGNLAFAVEDPQKFKIQARDEAIKKAKEEAKSMAKALDVKLGKVIRFNEEGMPRFPVEPRMMMAAKALDSESLVSPQIQIGEQKISANVVVTYEIR